MKPSKPNALIPKFRLSLSLDQMKTIHASLCIDPTKILENAELISWIGKNIRKAEFGILEASHTSRETSSSILSPKTQEVLEGIKEASKESCFNSYLKDPSTLEDSALLAALEYKMENPTECGSLTEEEKEVLNDALTRKLLGNL